MGVYRVDLPEGAYTVADHSPSRVVIADNAGDAVALAGTLTPGDGAPWSQATATLLTGSVDFSRYTFGFIVPHTTDNGFATDKHVTYKPLSTDAVADIGAGLVAAALALGLTGANYVSGTHKVNLPAALDVGKDAITIDTPTFQGESMADVLNVPGGNSHALGGNDFPDYALTGTSIKPTVDVASGTAATARNVDLTPLTTGINPGPVGELVEFY